MIPADTAEDLRARIAATRHLPRVDEEHHRLIDGGNDGFVAAAAILLMAGLGYLGWTTQHILSAPLFAASAWGIAEYFVKVRRHTLTGIIASFAFFGVGAALLTLSAYWHQARLAIMPLLGGLADHLPPEARRGA